ncbi:MAG: hypothetical protein HKN76_20685 [Saprospiraceae bacterium]|nr:hypothetical protein [Saprospiraceae bacterium]
MPIILWVLQVLLALHTLIGAIWKFSNSEQAVESLSSSPHAVWLSLIVIELFCSLGLVIAAVRKSWGKLIPIAALIIAAEMVFFTALHLYSGNEDHFQMIYWLVVAAVCAFIAFGRYVLKPI